MIEDEAGSEQVNQTLGYVGMIHSNFPVNAVYQWVLAAPRKRFCSYSFVTVVKLMSKH